MSFINLSTKNRICNDKVKIITSLSIMGLLSFMVIILFNHVVSSNSDKLIVDIDNSVENLISSEDSSSELELLANDNIDVTPAVMVVSTENDSAETVTPTISETTTETVTETTTEPTKPTFTEKKISCVVYATSKLNVRKKPTTDSDIVKTLKAGDKIDVIAKTSNGWYKTCNNNYVASSLTSSKSPITPTPTPTPKSTTKATTKATTKQENKKETKDTKTTAKSSSASTSCKITFYGPQKKSDGSLSKTTATGTTCTQGRTCAADWSIYPRGSVIHIENDPLGGDGNYVVEDRGPAVTGNHIDIYVDDVSQYSTTTRNVSK